jgi:hypothetical protein
MITTAPDGAATGDEMSKVYETHQAVKAYHAKIDACRADAAKPSELQPAACVYSDTRSEAGYLVSVYCFPRGLGGATSDPVLRSSELFRVDRIRLNPKNGKPWQKSVTLGYFTNPVDAFSFARTDLSTTPRWDRVVR